MKVNEIKPVEAINYLSFAKNKNTNQEKKQKEVEKETKDNFDDIFQECLKEYV
jgi:hypothetical protein